MERMARVYLLFSEGFDEWLKNGFKEIADSVLTMSNTYFKDIKPA